MKLHTVLFPEDTWAAVKAEANRQRISASYLIRRELTLYIAKRVSHEPAPVSSTKLRRAAK
jgi:hypothetical protein